MQPCTCTHTHASDFCRLGVPEQALGRIVLGFGFVVEDIQTSWTFIHTCSHANATFCRKELRNHSNNNIKPWKLFTYDSTCITTTHVYTCISGVLVCHIHVYTCTSMQLPFSTCALVQMRLWTQARQMGAYAARCMVAHTSKKEKLHYNNIMKPLIKDSPSYRQPFYLQQMSHVLPIDITIYFQPLIWNNL